MSLENWVAGKLKEWDIKPAGENGSYFQWFNFPYTDVNDIGSLTLNLPQTDGSVIRKNYTFPDEYYPGMNSGNGEITAEVVFSMAGYRTMSIGTTGGYKKVYYHLPGDDPDVVTIDIMEDVAKMIYVALTNMANDPSLNSR